MPFQDEKSKLAGLRIEHCILIFLLSTNILLIVK